tara:strand:- start:323 stop:739 length:417 start_codon:yes stop_codon:yes gene_type:complete
VPRARNINDYLWNKLDTKHKLIAMGAMLVLGPIAYWVGDSIPTGYEGQMGIRDACESVSKPMSPKSLMAHFPEGSYTGRCIPETQECGEFTDASGVTWHFPCPNGRCAMYWLVDGWTCRVDLSDGHLRAMGPGELEIP